jgi:radical SAM protein with 4Fe4S-binding SPASM domain
MLNDKYSPFISIKEQRGAGEVIEDYRVVGEEYETKLTNIFKEMFNKDIPFRQAEDINTCNRCDYRKICKLINEPSY